MAKTLDGQVAIVTGAGRGFGKAIAQRYLAAYCTGKVAQNRLMAETSLEAKSHGVSLFAIDPGFVFTGLAESTMNSPEAQQWMPAMVKRLREMQNNPNKDVDLERCVDLTSGRYDALSGYYMELPDDLDAMLKDVNVARKPMGVGGAL